MRSLEVGGKPSPRDGENPALGSLVAIKQTSILLCFNPLWSGRSRPTKMCCEGSYVPDSKGNPQDTLTGSFVT